MRGFVGYDSLQEKQDTFKHLRSKLPDRKESYTQGVHPYSNEEMRALLDQQNSQKDTEYYHKEKEDGRFFARNLWPEGEIGQNLRKVWEEYNDLMEQKVREIY